ncbi:MAG: hypothetical protein ABSA91_15795 [Acidimicrobiales bacterium]
METFLVRLWPPDDAAKRDGTTSRLVLRGVVEAGGRHGRRPFSEAEQLVVQLQEALADRLRERAEQTLEACNREEGAL